MKRNFTNLDARWQYKCSYCNYLNSPSQFGLETVVAGNVLMHTCKGCETISEINIESLKAVK